MCPNIVILGSTRGSSIQDTLTAIDNGTLNARVVGVLSNKANAPILQRATDHNIPCQTVVPNTGESRVDYDNRMIHAIDTYNPDMVLMVGYMRIVSPVFCDAYMGRLFNVHPSLLPAHRGIMDLAVHQSVLDAGDKNSGCTIHRVIPVVDGGENVVQLSCAVLSDDTAETLKFRVQKLESQAWINLIQEWKQHVQ